MTRTSILLNTDSYKASHFLQYPMGTKFVNSYIEARKGADWDRVLFFGLQAFVKEYLEKPFTEADIKEAREFFGDHGEPFNAEGWEYILARHAGHLPLTISCVPEGYLYPVGTPLVQVMNTDEVVPWLTSYVETALLRAVWYPSTVATLSYHVKKEIWDALLKSSDDPVGQIGFKLHDFGARGASSLETAGLGGMAHLVNFMGTDTLEGILYARRYYDAKMAGFSIPAAEHSTITVWGRDKEVQAYRKMLHQFAKPGSLVAVVSDSYDIYNAVEKLWGETLRSAVIESGATVVVRPDSGDPVDTPIWCIEKLMEKFGHTVNSKGFRVLPSCVRVIQGDGCTPETIRGILFRMLMRGLSVDNIAFGMGAGILQHVNRDMLKFAMKASAAKVMGEWVPVSKSPVGDPSKASKSGVQAVILPDADFTRMNELKVTTRNIGGPWPQDDILDPRYILDHEPFDAYDTFDQIRARAGAEFKV